MKYLCMLLVYFSISELRAEDLPSEITVVSKVVFKTKFFNENNKPIELADKNVVLKKMSIENKNEYAEFTDSGSFHSPFDVVATMDIEKIDFSKMNTLEQYIEIFGNYKDITDAWGSEDKWHYTKNICKIAIINDKPIGIQIFLMVSKAKGDNKTVVDEAIVRVLK